MTNSEALWKSLTTHHRAGAADRAAVADPSRFSSEEKKVARHLMIMLEYGPSYLPTLQRQARRLTEKAGEDTEGLWYVLETAAVDANFLRWALSVQANIYGTVKLLIDRYERYRAQEEQRQFDDSTEGRKARYASYPGVKS